VKRTIIFLHANTMESSNPGTTPAEPDARNSLAHILANEPDAEAEAPSTPAPHDAPSTPAQFAPAAHSTPILPAPSSEQRRSLSGPPDEASASFASQSQPTLQPTVKEEDSAASPNPESTPAAATGPDNKPMYTATTTTTRRNANGSVSSVYSGNKIRHLKKEDGVPLWRKDIQFDFLKYVFEDDKKVFHKVSDKSYGHTFADIYLDAMAKSSKCSKILKDKLLTERPAALNMAMVCLLVNVGRMNTTLNCVLHAFSLAMGMY
jgi:Ino eighty subunit 1